VSLLSLLAACEGPQYFGDTGASDAGGTIQGLSVEQAELVGQVYTLSWGTAEALPGRVQARYDGEIVLTSPWSEATTEHVVDLVGLKPNRLYELQVQVQDGDEVLSSRRIEAETGGIPSWLPELEVSSSQPPEGLFMTPVYLGDPGNEAHGIVLYDTDGDVVWHTEEASLDTIQTTVSRDGSQLIHLDTQALVWRNWRGEETRRFEHEQIHHSFAELPDGTMGLIFVHPTEYGGDYWLDQSMVELAPDGTVETVWTSSEHLDAMGIDADDWTDVRKFGHANALSWLEEEDAWLLGLSEWGVVVAVSRSTGEVLWSINTAGGGTLEFSGGAPWTMQHRLELRDDALLAYVNSTEDSQCARAVEVELDHAASTATQVWSYEGGTCHSTFALGYAQRLPDDHRLVTWSTSGVIEVIDAADEPVLKFATDFGYAFGYGEWIDRSGW